MILPDEYLVDDLEPFIFIEIETLAESIVCIFSAIKCSLKLQQWTACFYRLKKILSVRFYYIYIAKCCGACNAYSTIPFKLIYTICYKWGSQFGI